MISFSKRMICSNRRLLLQRKLASSLLLVRIKKMEANNWQIVMLKGKPLQIILRLLKNKWCNQQQFQSKTRTRPLWMRLSNKWIKFTKKRRQMRPKSRRKINSKTKFWESLPKLSMTRIRNRQLHLAKSNQKSRSFNRLRRRIERRPWRMQDSTA